MVNLDEMLPTSEAARALGISPVYLRDLLKAGRLPCVRTRLGRLVAVEDVERFRLEREAKHRNRAGRG